MVVVCPTAIFAGEALIEPVGFDGVGVAVGVGVGVGHVEVLTSFEAELHAPQSAR